MKKMRSNNRRAPAAFALALGLLPMVAAPAFADKRTESASSYQRGFERFERGDVRGARIELLKALQADPKNELARLLQARVALESGNGVAAQTEIEKAIAAGVPRDKTRHLMAHALLLQRQFDRAMREVDPAAIPPQFASYAARIRGRIYMAQEQRERAGPEFEQAYKLAPTSAEAMVDLARFRMMTGNAAEGGKLIDRALAHEPTSTNALLLKGNLTRSQAGLEKALPYFNQALQVDPNNIEVLLERAATLGDLRREKEARADLRKVQGLIPDHPLALYLEAVLEARAGRFQQANALMTRTKGLLDRYPPAMLLQGVLGYQLNNLPQANKHLSSLVAAAPNSSLARKLLAAVQLRRGDPNGAIETLRPVVAGKNVDFRTLSMMGSAYAQSGKFEEAQQYLERAASVAPNEQSVRTQLAMTQVAQGENAAASAELQSVLKANPDSLHALMLTTLLDLRQKRYNAALASTNRMVKAHPQLPIGYNMRGVALLGLKNLKGAEANFRAAIQKKSDFVEARRNLAQILIATGRADAGRQELLRVVEIDRNDVPAMMMLSSLAAKSGNTDDRINWLRRAATAKPLALQPRAMLTRAYVQTGQINRAVTEASAIERDFARNPAALELAGLTYLAGRRPQDAESAFNRLASLEPNNVGVRVQLARAQLAQKRTDAARATLNQALTLPKQNLVPAYAELIALEMQAKRTPEALAVAERLRKSYPKTNFADIAVGDIQLKAGRVPQAIAAYQAARKIKFDRAVASRLAQAQLRARQPAQAIATMQTYRKANPRDQIASVQLADIYLQTKQVRPAIAIYEGLRKQGPAANDPAILNNLAWSYHQLRDNRALALAERAYRLSPRTPAIQDTLGQILVETKKDPKRGLSLLQAAVKASPRDSDMRYRLAQAYRVNGRRADAARELQVVLKTPGFDQAPQARQMLAQLRGS